MRVFFFPKFPISFKPESLFHIPPPMAETQTPPSSTSISSFPIIAVAVIGICATALVLVAYYIFVIKCCLNWHRIQLLRRFSLSRRRSDVPILQHPAEPRGLDPSTIRSIPIIQYKYLSNAGECAVCLTEFQPDEKLRQIPICQHLFHVDCIDVWLHNNSNCPICRASISAHNWLIPADRTQPSSDFASSFCPVAAADEDFVVLEVGRDRDRRRAELKVTSMGDECIDMREKDEEFMVQPIRRSFSMDSSGDRQLYTAVQAAVNGGDGGGENEVEGCSNRVRRSFFSFGSGRGSRNAVLPIHFQP